MDGTLLIGSYTSVRNDGVPGQITSVEEDFLSADPGSPPQVDLEGGGASGQVPANRAQCPHSSRKLWVTNGCKVKGRRWSFLSPASRAEDSTTDPTLEVKGHLIPSGIHLITDRKDLNTQEPFRPVQTRILADHQVHGSGISRGGVAAEGAVRVVARS